MVDAVLVGCGAMSKAWLEAARRIDGLSIVGLVDIDHRARPLARRGIRPRRRARRRFARRDARPPARRRRVRRRRAGGARRRSRRAAFAHGCHLLSEKPLAASLDEARAIVAAAREAERIHAVVQNRRYHPGVRRIRRFLARGALGRLTSVHCDFFLAPHFGGFREEMEHVLLLDMAIHTFDAARAMTGLEAKRVYCREWNPPNSWYRQGASAAAIFDMAGGAVFTYRGSWCADGAPTSWEAAWRIVGERGSLVWDGFDAIRAEAVDGERARRPVRPDASRSKFRRSIRPTASAAISASCRISSPPSTGGPPPETAGDRQPEEPGHGVRRGRERREPAVPSRSQPRGRRA